MVVVGRAHMFKVGSCMTHAFFAPQQFLYTLSARLIPKFADLSVHISTHSFSLRAVYFIIINALSGYSRTQISSNIKKKKKEKRKITNSAFQSSWRI